VIFQFSLLQVSVVVCVTKKEVGIIKKKRERILQYKKLKTTTITTTGKIMVRYLVIAYKKQRKI